MFYTYFKVVVPCIILLYGGHKMLMRYPQICQIGTVNVLDTVDL